MKIKQLLEAIQKAKDSGLVNDNSKVFIDLPIRFFKNGKKIELSETHCVSVQHAAAIDFDDNLPNQFEIIADEKEIRRIYKENGIFLLDEVGKIA